MSDDNDNSNKEGGAGKVKSVAINVRKGAEILGACWNYGMRGIEDIAEARVKGRTKGEIARKFDNAAANAALAGNDPAEIRQMQSNFLAEQMQYYANVKAIGDLAMPRINAGAKAEDVRVDTIMHLREKCKIISEEQMRDMLAKILAGEINAPGSFSKKTIDVVSSLGRADVEDFSKLGSFCVVLGKEGIAIVLGVDGDIYNQHGVNFASLSNLDSLGLVIHSPTEHGVDPKRLSPDNNPARLNVLYFDTAIRITIPAGNYLSLGIVHLTRAGRELLRVCDKEKIPEFPVYLKKAYESRGFAVELG